MEPSGRRIDAGPASHKHRNRNGTEPYQFVATGAGLDVAQDRSTVFALGTADLDDSGDVGFGDILAILLAWGNKGGPEDLDGNGIVDFGDLLIVLGSWGPCP